MASKIKITVNDRGHADPIIHCYEAQPSYHGKNGLRGIKIGSANLISAPHITEFTKFKVGGVFLALKGIFAESPNLDLSHLCGNWKCCRAEHLIYESRKDNLKRLNCPGLVKCSVVSHNWCNACVHTPRCIKKTEIE